jgi:nucleoside-diphosphate-sugar epimerase
MNILLTGGASDLAQVLTPQLLANGHTVARLDIRRPADDSGEFIQGSITDREMLGPVWYTSPPGMASMR